MRLALPATTLALAIALAAPTHAQGGSLRNGSEASKQAIVSVGAIGESAIGHVANASGYTEVGTTFSDGAAGATKAAKSLVEFSGAPLTVSDEVIVGRPEQPVPQPAPNVPYTPE